MQHFLNLIYGVIFGVANIIPGVSGGTMMVVFGVYDKLVEVLSFKLSAIKKNIMFLLLFGIGAAVGILGFAYVITWLFDNQPVAANMFFMGLILGSLPLIYRHATAKGKLKPYAFAAFIPALALVVGLTFLQNTSVSADPYSFSVKTENNISYITLANNSGRTVNKWSIELKEGSFYSAEFTAENAEVVCKPSLSAWLKGLIGGEKRNNKAVITGEFAEGSFVIAYKGGAALSDDNITLSVSYKMDIGFFATLFFATLVAAMAMIIPGVSGSFVMVLLGTYATVISAVKNLDIIALIPVAVGAVLGIVLGAKLISALLKRYSMAVYSAIMGLVAGSLYAILPDGIGLNLSTLIGVLAFAAGALISFIVGKHTKVEV